MSAPWLVLGEALATEATDTQPEEALFMGRMVASAALLAAVLLARFLARRALERADWKDQAAGTRTARQITRLSLLVLVLGLVVIWAPQLHTFAISAVALAAALVLATKELIMCLSGAVLRASTGAYDLGDRIELEGLRGDVIRIGLLSTTILEVGPAHQRSGRAVVLPNSMLLAKPVVNESFTDEFVLHTFGVPLARAADWREAERRLLELAGELCAPWQEQVRARLERLARDHGLPAPNSEPKVSLQLPDEDSLLLLVRIPVPARQKARVEQEILRRFLLGRDVA